MTTVNVTFKVEVPEDWYADVLYCADLFDPSVSGYWAKGIRVLGLKGESLWVVAEEFEERRVDLHPAEIQAVVTGVLGAVHGSDVDPLPLGPGYYLLGRRGAREMFKHACEATSTLSDSEWDAKVWDVALQKTLFGAVVYS